MHVALSYQNNKIAPLTFNPHYDIFGSELRVLACADTGARTPLGVRQYSLSCYARIKCDEHIPLERGMKMHITIVHSGHDCSRQTTT